MPRAASGPFPLFFTPTARASAVLARTRDSAAFALRVACPVVQAVKRASAEDRRHLVLLGPALCVLTAAVYVKFPRDIHSRDGIEGGDRYFHPQRCLLVWIVLARARHLTTRPHQIAVGALVVPAAQGLTLHWGSAA